MQPASSRVALVLAAVAALTACGSSNGPTPLPCTYTTTLSTAAFGSSGGSGSVSVTTATGCTWSASAGSSWLTITAGASGTGAGVVTFAVAANSDAAARNGSLMVAGQSLAIQQEGAPVACAFALTPASASFGKDGGTGSVGIATTPTCAWSAATDNTPWLTVANGAGTGPGTVSYTVAKNDRPGSRSGALRIAGQSFGVTQSGDTGVCAYSVAPVEFAPCMAASEMATEVVTQADCPWTAAPGASWIAVSAGASGSGSGTVRFRVTDNWDAPRSGTVMVRWPTPTAGQNVRVAQAGCYYAVSRDSFAFSSTGGSGSFDVLQQSEPNTCGGPLQNACVWTASSDSAWLTITGSMPRSGDDRVSFTVAANPGSASRTATVTVRDKVVRITQAGS